MENLVLQAIGTTEVEKINKIKRNKEFLRKLIGDFKEVYTIYVDNEDQQYSTKYNIRKFTNNRATLFFSADENGCTFRTELIGYRRCTTKEWDLGWIVEKYDTSKGDIRIMKDEINAFGRIDVVIKFTDVSGNLMDIIKDITRIFDKERVSKKF